MRLQVGTNAAALERVNANLEHAEHEERLIRAIYEGLRTSHLGEETTVDSMTIYTSKRSQFEEVVVVLPEKTSRLLTSELQYAAVTRASGRFTVIGNESVLRQAVEGSVHRASGLGVRLWGGGS